MSPGGSASAARPPRTSRAASSPPRATTCCAARRWPRSRRWRAPARRRAHEHRAPTASQHRRAAQAAGGDAVVGLRPEERSERMSTVIIIASRRNLLAAAVDLGLTPVLVRGPGQPDDEQLRLAKEVTCTDLFDEDGVVAEVERLYHRYGAVRVLSLSEDGLLPAARVNERHGLGGNSLDCVRLLKDKSAMRRRLAEVGLSPVR